MIHHYQFCFRLQISCATGEINLFIYNFYDSSSSPALMSVNWYNCWDLDLVYRDAINSGMRIEIRAPLPRLMPTSVPIIVWSPHSDLPKILLKFRFRTITVTSSDQEVLGLFLSIWSKNQCHFLHLNSFNLLALISLLSKTRVWEWKFYFYSFISFFCIF